MKIQDDLSQLIVHSDSPLNAEPTADRLRENFVTPRELFYIRNHGTLPEVDAARYRLEIGGLVNQPLALSLDDLRNNFPKRELLVSLECAGNRRDELSAIAPIPNETPWQAQAIGNGRWAGVALWEVLLAAEAREDAWHVAFEGLDEIVRGENKFSFGGSIPIEKAMSAEVLLAYEMNDAPLSPAHGFPLRLVTPGYIGARSVKWLAKLTLQAEPSANYFQAHAYQLFPPHVRADNADWSKGLRLGEFAVNAVICRPRAGERLKNNLTRVEGYAIGGGGRAVERVDVSTDDGNNWTTADLIGDSAPWVWRFWEVELALERGENEIVARAWDSGANTQPEDAAKIWNFKGYSNNAWHRVKVFIAG